MVAIGTLLLESKGIPLHAAAASENQEQVRMECGRRGPRVIERPTRDDGTRKRVPAGHTVPVETFL